MPVSQCELEQELQRTASMTSRALIHLLGAADAHECSNM